MKNEKILNLDCDEVLLQWGPAFKKFCQSKNINYQDDDNRKIIDILGWDLAFELVDEFNTNPKYFTNLQPYEDAAKYIPIIHNDGWTINIITACGTSENAYNMRKENLSKMFGNVFNKILTVNYLDSKQPHLEKFKPTFWVDDSWIHIESGLAAGHKCIHLARIHDKNKHDPRVFDAKSFKDIYKIINTK